MKATKFLVALLLGFVSPSFAQVGNWTQRFPTGTPPVRFSPALAYDSAHAQVVLFGGVYNTYLSDTWIWDGSNWIQKFPSISPPGRQGQGMAYDAQHGQVVLFGGESINNGVQTLFGDTWIWDGSNWTQKFPANTPGPRVGHTMVYDSVRNQVLLFGGSSCCAILGDTWVWDGANWTLDTPATNPPNRIYAAMTFDTTRGEAVLFGGVSGTIFSDTWVWDGSNWTQRFPAIKPQAREFFLAPEPLAYDIVQGRVLLFGGGLTSGSLSDTWIWDGSNWAQQSPPTSPPSMAGYAMAYDAARSDVILFGTPSSGPGPETWVWGGPASCSFPPTFAEAVANGVLVPTVSLGDIQTNFIPGCGLTLNEAAQLGGYDHFNWVQVVTEHDGLAACQATDPVWPFAYPGSIYCLGVANLITESLTLPSVPFFDVPPGGFLYQLSACSSASGQICSFPVEDSLPWYWDEKYTFNFQLAQGTSVPQVVAEESGCGSGLTTCTTLGFEDMPSCHVLGLVPCTDRFTTTLAGVRNDGSGDALNVAACQVGLPLGCKNNIGTGFNWHVLGQSLSIDGRLQSFQPDPDTTVIFDSFKVPGVSGFTQAELQLFAKNGISIRDETGTTVPVIVDIKPGEDPSSINPQSSGTTPVAIISTPGFQAATQINIASLTFGHTGNEASLASCVAEDVNGDGLLDLVCHFVTKASAFQAGDTVGILKGKTLAGAPIYGEDSIAIVPGT